MNSNYHSLFIQTLLEEGFQQYGRNLSNYSKLLERINNKLDSNTACIKEMNADIEVIKEGNKDENNKIEEVQSKIYDLKEDID